jgi:uncharacterized SAM-binding protein YcdF (DUF218 family)
MKGFWPQLKVILKKLLHFAKAFFITAGVLFTLMIALGFTEKPYWIYYWLGTSKSQIEKTPDYIVVMGGGGMPGGEGMMRCFYAAAAADSFPNARLIIALPADSLNFSESDTYKMFKELVFRGVDSARISFEIEGTNTFTQARKIAGSLKKSNSILVITSPEHTRRSVLTFKKAGIAFVGGWPAFETAIDNNLLLTKTERRQKFQTPERQVSLRYNIWNYLKLEIIIAREFMALGYYKFRGYI